MNTGSLSFLGRVAHKFIRMNVLPRQEKRTTICTPDLLIPENFMKREKIDLPKIILLHIEKCVGKIHLLPFAGLVKKLLVEEGAYELEVEE